MLRTTWGVGVPAAARQSQSRTKTCTAQHFSIVVVVSHKMVAEIKWQPSFL